MWAKGPNSLNSLLEILIRWRDYPMAAYHQVVTGDGEKFL